MLNPQNAGPEPVRAEAAPGHFQALIQSFTRVSFYPSIARQPLGRCFAYLFLLVAIVWVADAYHVFGVIEHIQEVAIQRVKERMPNILIENGTVSVDVSGPVVLFELSEQGKKYVVAVDPEEQLDLRNYEAALVLQKHALATQSGIQTRMVNLHKVKYLKLGPKDAEVYIQKACDFLAVLTIFLLPFWHFFAKLVTALFFSIGALIANSSGRRGYSYRSLFQISLYALTPVILLETIGCLTDHSLWTLGFFMGMTLAALGTLARPTERPAAP